MKNWSKFLICACIMVLSAGCGEKELDRNAVPGDNNSKDAVYMNVAVQLPVGPGTRSETNPGGGSSSGVEVGKDNENKVNSILLVIADKDNKFIAYGDRSGETLHSVTSDKVASVQTISKSTLKEYYGDNGVLTDEERQISVFVFCNPTKALSDYISEVKKGDSNWYDGVCSLSETPAGEADNAAIWGGTKHDGGFLMSTASVSGKKRLPASFSDWDDYTSADKAFNLSGMNNASTDKEINNGSAIPVERSVARFDFRDGSAGDNTYDVIKNSENNTIVKIQLQKMALVNMSRNFYYLRRVSNGGVDDPVTLCGLETSSNYVIDTDALAKRNPSTIISGNKYSDHFNFCLGSTADGKWTIDAIARNQWYTSKVEDVLGGVTSDKDYRIWRYVTENTIPEADQQKNGLSTGIVFKGEMIAADGATGSLVDAISNATGNAADAILYSYSNSIYVTWKEVRAHAIEAGVGSEFYQAVFGVNLKVEPKAESDTTAAVYSDDVNSPDYKWDVWHNKNSHITDGPSLSEFKAAATKANFTLYESSVDADYGAGYYCYYFYWNRHNDNGNNGVMNPMEFSVVRNNVYKLAVTKINRLGHPRVSENNPDPVDPDDPNEKGDVYLNVSVEVLHWTVRENNIEF